jgi:hypothetical protein
MYGVGGKVAHPAGIAEAMSFQRTPCMVTAPIVMPLIVGRYRNSREKSELEGPPSLVNNRIVIGQSRQ